MAVQNHIYIYIGQSGEPVILNVDNAADGQVLEQLGALKMPESLVEEVFGENIQYADNTTCTITDNPDNAEFPFNVVFDSSKIPENQKRNTGNLAGTAMPSSKFIDINFTFSQVNGYMNSNTFTAPANGYISILFDVTSTNNTHYCNVMTKQYDGDEDYILRLNAQKNMNDNSGRICGFVPIKKGHVCIVGYVGTLVNTVSYPFKARFFYAEGEI